jgi:hypothetical protein
LQYPFDVRPDATSSAKLTTNKYRLRFRLMESKFPQLIAVLFLRELTSRGRLASKRWQCPICGNTLSSLPWQNWRYAETGHRRHRSCRPTQVIFGCSCARSNALSAVRASPNSGRWTDDGVMLHCCAARSRGHYRDFDEFDPLSQSLLCHWRRCQRKRFPGQCASQHERREGSAAEKLGSSRLVLTPLALTR